MNVYENSVAHKYAIENSIPYNIITYPDTTGNKIAISNTQITGNTVSFNANPQTNNELQGTFLVAIYDTNGAFVDVKQYPAEAETNISFDKKDNYDSAKIFWWFDTKSMYPMAECKGIKMSELKEGYTITKNYDETRGSVRITENGREITSAVAGTQVTISVSVNNDYTALSPMVTDMNGNAIDVTDNTFIMPDSDVTVKVVFVDIFSSGTCGINHTLKWTLYDNGTLIISGNGQMQDFASSNETPWSKYKDDIKIVAIQNGVTRISKNAFANCSKIKRVLIDKSVTEIETDAFKGCTDLRRVEYGAAQQNWEELYIGSGNEQIQNAEFIYNSPLTDTAQIDLDYLLYEKQEDTTITITDCLPDAVEINIPGQIEELPVIIIGENAFSGCASLTEIHIPSSVNEIGSQAFYGCNNLINFAIPSSIMRIGEDAFSGCSGLKNIYITDVTKWCEIKFGSSSSNPMYYADNLYVNNVLTTDLIIPNDAISIGEYAFSGCSGLTSVDIPNSVTSIGGSAFYNCNNLQDVHITDIAKWCEVDFSDYDSNPMYYADNLYRPPANATGYE